MVSCKRLPRARHLVTVEGQLKLDRAFRVLLLDRDGPGVLLPRAPLQPIVPQEPTVLEELDRGCLAPSVDVPSGSFDVQTGVAVAHIEPCADGVTDQLELPLNNIAPPMMVRLALVLPLAGAARGGLLSGSGQAGAQGHHENE